MERRMEPEFRTPEFDPRVCSRDKEGIVTQYETVPDTIHEIHGGS